MIRIKRKTILLFSYNDKIEKNHFVPTRLSYVMAGTHLCTLLNHSNRINLIANLARGDWSCNNLFTHPHIVYELQMFKHFWIGITKITRFTGLFSNRLSRVLLCVCLCLRCASNDYFAYNELRPYTIHRFVEDTIILDLWNYVQFDFVFGRFISNCYGFSMSQRHFRPKFATNITTKQKYPYTCIFSLVFYWYFCIIAVNA